MAFRINEYSIIPNDKRPKLYKEMQTNPYDLEELDLTKLFTYLDDKNEKINNNIRNHYYRVMKFKYYGEFLNVVNFSLLFYRLNFDVVFENQNSHSKQVFIFLELSTLLCAIFLVLLFYQSKKVMSEIKLMMLISVILMILSKNISPFTGFEKSIHKYANNMHLNYEKKPFNYKNKYIKDPFERTEPLSFIKITYFLFLIIFLLFNEYLGNSENSNQSTSFLISILILIISLIHEQILMKIRCMLIGINIFELLPKIRKFANTCSDDIVLITYIINSIICGVSLSYIDENKTLIWLCISNILFIFVYPTFFNYKYHKEKLLMKGMWDAPELTKIQ